MPILRSSHGTGSEILRTVRLEENSPFYGISHIESVLHPLRSAPLHRYALLWKMRYPDSLTTGNH